ncbi:ABC transporter transmembrane domain-containing protein [Enterococcus faecalis]|uniref:ABC transporter transmembrane domain-containing protein n=1 Tax=Enterococcus faecalis TaxID=1351 RepID=UPI003888CAB8
MIFNKFVKENLVAFSFIVILILLNSMIALPFPYISKIIIDNILLNGSYNLIPNVVLFFSLLVLSQMVVGRLTAFKLANFFQMFINKTRIKVFSNFVENNYIEEGRGKLETVVLSDIEMLSSSYQQIISGVCSNVVLLVGYTVIVFIINWKLSIITFLFLPMYIYWVNKVGNNIKIFNETNQKLKENLYADMNKSLTNILVIKIYDFYSIVKVIFEKSVEKSGEANKKLILYQNFINIIANVIVVAAQFIPLFVGIYLFRNGEVSIGALIAFNSYTSNIFGPLTSLISLLPTKKNAEVYNQRVSELINFPKYDKSKDRFELNDSEQKTNKELLVVRNMELLSEQKKILNIKMFSINKGEFCKIEGNNGSGKSLFLKSLCNIYLNYSGEVYISGKLVNKGKTITELSKEIVYVSNDQGFIFNSISKELEELSELLDYLDIQKALKTVNMLGREKDSSFSTGEYQRMRIARALIKRPKILILDEIFSNIDFEMTSKILSNLRNNYPDMALIFVEHHFLAEDFDYTIKYIENEILIE